MNFQFSAKNIPESERGLQRFFEVIPGLTSWTILLGMVFLSFTRPIHAAVIIIAFDIFWILRLFYMTIFLVLSYARLSIEKKTDWMERVRMIDRMIETGVEPSLTRRGLSFWKKLSMREYQREMHALIASGSKPPHSKDILHLVLLPIVRETTPIIEGGLASFADSHFPHSQTIVVLALEDRADERVKRDVEAVRQKYGSEFYDLKVIVHPSGLPGEARVKGANVTYAAKQMAVYFQEKGIPYEHVIVSCFDADTVADPDYFSCLTYQFMVCPDRERASFQPIPMYHNNIWEVPGFVRVLESGSSFFQLVEATDPEKLVTFSSHSMSFKALVEVNYWPVDMISDDSAIFWKSYIHYDGNYRVVPLFVTLSMDVADAGSWLKTAGHVYKQKRRWAWGVENFPIVMRAFLKANKISLYNKLRHGIKLFEIHIAWATWAFLLSVISWLPALFAGKEMTEHVIYYNTPRITGIIFGLSTLALLISISISLLALPKRRKKESILRRVIFAVQWLFLPWIFTFLSTVPALDAQTRLMRGKYMEKWGTDQRQPGV